MTSRFPSASSSTTAAACATSEPRWPRRRWRWCAGTLLYQATGNSAYLFQARQTATAALAYFSPERLGSENPFFVAVYFRNLLYLDAVTHDPPGPAIAQNYVNYAWQQRRLSDYVFVAGSPPSAQLLYQAAIVQIYALLSIPADDYF